MSAPPRRRSRRLATSSSASAPSPDTPPPARLLDLPTDLLVRAISRCDPADIARVAAVSLLFHASLALEAIRLWAQERGFELPAQPEGEAMHSSRRHAGSSKPRSCAHKRMPSSAREA